MSIELSDIDCAREGCEKKVPARGARDGDPFCSTLCCRITFGLEAVPSREWQPGLDRCKGCGGELSRYTPGCQRCVSRKKNRVKAGTA